MGVTGLWRLIEPAGKPVPIETLENKVLAVDISIWLHQMVKGYQDAKGAPMPNAHLLGLFQRLCKLLYFRIKPVFVFDGGFPDLKKETIAKRQDNKAKLNSESERLKREILLLLGKKTAIGSLLGKQTSPKKQTRAEDPADSDDLFKLPEIENPADSSSESESEEEATTVPFIDLHSVDIESEDFKSMPLKEKHDLLIELKETRKMNSWGKLHELPKDSDNFSDFQMARLLKRRKVQECLEETEKEIGGNAMTLNELESLLNEEGINTNIDSLPTKRIASNDTTRYLLISNVKQALEDAKKAENEKAKASSSKFECVQETEENKEEPTCTNRSHEEFDEDLQKAIQMSLECADNDTPKETVKGEESPDSTYMLDSEYSDTSEEEVTDFDFNAAKAYIMQNTDYTSKAIKNMIGSTNTSKDSSKPKSRVNEIMKELNLDVSTSLMNNNGKEIDSEPEMQTVDISSSDDECIEINKTSDSVIEIKNSNKRHEVIDLDTTVEDSNVSVNNECFEEPNLPSEAVESSESDEDFEDVPEETVKQTPKAVVELNLEIKNTLEDDIFADVFENSNNVINNDSIELEYEAKQEINVTVPVKTIDQPLIKDKSNTPNAKEVLLESGIETNKSNTIVPNEVGNDESNIKGVENCVQEYEGISENITESSEFKNANSDNKQVKENDIEKEPREVMTTEQLNSMADELQKEQEQLFQEKSRLERMGRNITEQMTKDAQELLQIFGIPYVVAPSEAEAQCAFLESAKLTDGTITDDSDIWLFGGKTVYKNFFNQKKLVVQYLAERIDKSFNLSREQLVLLALLVGSDYTTGVNGVGPVTALEILASFSCSRKDLLLFQAGNNQQARYSALVTGLQEFKKWVRSGKRTEDTNLRKKLRNVSVTDDFPSLRVVQAYMEPKVETCKEKFTWGDLDLTVLRDFTKKKFGWSQNKLDEILNPVLKRMQERKSQRSMQDYFQRKIEFHSLDDQMSKRVKAAVEKMGNSEDVEKNADTTGTNPEDGMKPPKKVPRKRKPKDSAIDIKIKRKPKVKNSSDEPSDAAEPSTSKLLPNVIAVEDVTSSTFDIKVPKLNRYQEIIPQREQDRMNVLKTKLKAIETYRKSKLNQKGVKTRRVNVPKEKANLSESDSD